jgi:hypothetical protein
MSTSAGGARESVVNVAEQVMTLKERMNQRGPEDIVIWQELDVDEVAEVKRRRERPGGEDRWGHICRGERSHRDA